MQRPGRPSRQGRETSKVWLPVPGLLPTCQGMQCVTCWLFTWVLSHFSKKTACCPCSQTVGLSPEGAGVGAGLLSPPEQCVTALRMIRWSPKDRRRQTAFVIKARAAMPLTLGQHLIGSRLSHGDFMETLGCGDGAETASKVRMVVTVAV